MKNFLWIFCFCLLLFSCRKSDHIVPSQTSDFYPLQPGHYIDYDLDSTVFVDFGSRMEVRHYQAREIIGGLIQDNAGRDSYPISRYIRKDESDPWTPSITYLATPGKRAVEVVENNLRYVKLAFPVEDDFSWKGNSYIDTRSTDLDLGYMTDWDYRYDSVGAKISIGELTFDNTVKVSERDEFLGQDPSIPETPYAEKNFAFEKYAAGVGLISRVFLHWVYQGAVSGRPAFYDGYGITMTITGYGEQ